ncbi:MAG: tRNA epoxyqueuosine(34) reductase QueG [Nibricoccus sp.]
MNTRQEGLRTRLLALGFDAVRFARIDSVEGEFLRGWLAEGRHADMQWMERSAEKRLDPQQVLTGARSIVLLGVNYWKTGKAPMEHAPVWARYSLYLDYHDTLKPALVAAGKLIEEIYGVSGTGYRYYVDTGPVVERGWAARSGLGFVGKNGMLISREFGNWLFLAAVLTTVEFEPDAPLRTSSKGGEAVGLLCGKCTRCMDACPTAAIVKPGVVDARLCISYQTIENRGIIPRDLRSKIGNRIYGCDVCLEVCPWNRFAQESRDILLQARDHIRKVTLRELLELTPETFAATFKGTAIKRVKLAGVLRNACIVAANVGATDCLNAIVRLTAHELPVVRAHAVWAVYRLAGSAEAAQLLDECRRRESAPEVIAEYEAEKS